ncbi:MAG: polyhydroxyalkanoate synthesis regulator DNA-binding domain-containing protein [Myxococcales bacterium]|jgi:polyhydroxyalkanoate synthesis repressor PhaR
MISGEVSDSAAPPSVRRIIKRYSNRKLYDTKGSSYVTLLQIAEMIREGEDVQIIDNATKEDKTDVTLALIISEELRTKPRGIPLSTLKALIRNKGERILTQLREGPIGKLMPVPGKEGEEGGVPGAPAVASVSSIPPSREEDEMSQSKEGKGLRATLEQWQSTIDERIRAVLPNFAAFRDLEQEVKRLSERLESLEKNLAGSSRPPENRE